MPLHLIVLAAGEGTRMASDQPKVLHQIAGAPMIAHTLSTADGMEVGTRVVITGHGGDAVKAALNEMDPDIQVVEQEQRNGTAHAATMATDALTGATGNVAIMNGDNPLITAETLAKMIETRQAGADLVVLGFHVHRPNRYGHLVHDGDQLQRIVEWKDATEDERALTLCNSGLYVGEAQTLLRLAKSVQNDNEAREFYLTDIVALANAEGLKVASVTCPEAEALGVNSRTELAAAEAAFQASARQSALENGVTLQAPDTVHFAMDTHIGRDAVIEPNVYFGPGVTIETGAHIRAFSHLEGCHVGKGAIVGPYTRLRPGAELSNDAKIGNFVEIKNAHIGDGAKVNHLSYVGDASVGAATNIGAGTVTCNYDGVSKHHTEIGERVFIGSNTLMVAPVTIGDDAITATGSVISKNVPPGDLAIARAKQDNKPGFAIRLFKKMRAANAAKNKG
ncbi:MAG: bifunctional UDP-N-acetylglucosamine diphosphorylase/glucosamine-1-phosphate N-acetyltransferase GlmU [Boseongicola sp.]|nr:MAG: bifunctional UDP-N-acetylglucosamine diphosphorylase/glucosamine-1-phosphate N-acetyltransferase GlmU [Boseongicola sp.]